MPSNTYDAVQLFGFGSGSTIALPTAESGQIVLRYGGWSLNELLATNVGATHMKYLDYAYKNEDWASARLPAGIYKLDDANPVPAVIMASALLANRLVNGEIDFDSTAENVLLRTVDKHSCSDIQEREDFIGLYWSDDWDADGKTHSTKLYLDKTYCHVMGGGVWEARLQ